MSHMPIPGLRTTEKVILPYGERHGEESQEGEEDNEKEEEQEEVGEPIHIPSFVVATPVIREGSKPS